MTSERKQDIYHQWQRFQAANQVPCAMYPWQAYTSSTYELWERTMRRCRNCGYSTDTLECGHPYAKYPKATCPELGEMVEVTFG